MEPNSQPEGHQEPPLATRVPYEPSRKPPGRSRAWVRLLLVLLVLGLFGSLMLNMLLFGVIGLSGFVAFDADRKVQEEFHSYNKDAKNKVAIISIEGTILTGEGFVKRQIDRAMEDENVKAVVLRVNSPGGTVTGSDYIYHHLCELVNKREIPMVVSMGGIAASGGYYVSMAVGDTPDTIFAEPSTWTGSIGVIIPHYDLSEFLKRYDIKEDSIASGPRKQMLSFTKSRTEEEREEHRKILKALVDDSFSRFKKVIKSGRREFRGKNSAALDELATGQIYTAQQAELNGLIDQIGFIEKAIERAIKLAELDADDVKVVKYKREPSLAALLLGGKARGQPFDLATMLELTAPRAYYLFTSLPPLVSSGE